MEDFIFGIANSTEQKQKAAALVACVYKQAGYISKGNYEARIEELLQKLLEPPVVTFTAHIKTQLVGAISVLPDKENGIPLDSLFKTELDQFRQEQKKLAEVGQFAIDTELLKKQDTLATNPATNKEISMSLIKFAFHYCLRKGYDRMCIGVNPKHESFYRYIGFIPYGEVKPYPMVENAPAALMYFDLKPYQNAYAAFTKTNAILSEILRHPPQEEILRAAGV